MIDRADLRVLIQAAVLLMAAAVTVLVLAGILGLAVQVFRLASG